MEAGDALAIYAAIVARAGIAWQVYSWRHRQQTRCEVKVGLHTVVQGPTHGGPEGVGVAVVNKSEHAVRWIGLAFQKQGGEPDDWLIPTGYLIPPPLPLNIPPRDSADVLLRRDKLEEAGMDWSRPVKVQVWLSTGEQFYSDEALLTGARQDE